MEEFTKSVVIIMESFEKNGSLPVKKIAILDEERIRQLENFRISPEGNSKDEKAGQLYQSGMERYAKETPNHMALIASDTSLTYGEFDREANRIANALIKAGLQPNSLVALLLPRTSRVLLAMHGVVKTGCAYIPCDPAYPADRISHILGNSGAKYMITTADRMDEFKDWDCLDVEELLKEENTEKPNVEIAPDSPAYLIYTSGSTGVPKGVVLTHRGIANYMTNSPANILVNGMVSDGHIITAITTLSFDMSLKEVGIPLFNGLTVVLADESQVNEPIGLAKLMKDTNTDMIQGTPSRIMALMASERFVERLKECKLIICAGEPYPESLRERLQSFPNVRLFNTYGPTEITVSSNIKELTKDSFVSVGKPQLGVEEFIVDADGNELPVGVIGELYIGGTGVAAGYKDLPKQTAERFVEYNGIRVYKSGDYARFTPQGNVQILGRKDNQIKLRGLRIEIGEIESTISSYPGVNRVAVKINKINGIEHLCAYYTADTQIDIADLRSSISKKLTQYMVPTAYMQLEKMPETLNGKLDLKNLPEAQIYRGNKSSNQSVANETEKNFCAIFEELLNIENVGVEESFFDLGGTSLLVTRVIVAAQKKGYTIKFADVFEHSTPKALAKFVQGKDDRDIDTEVYDYDYDSLKETLSKNNIDSFKTGQCRQLGDVLLTGAVGYLGIHILHELLEKEECKVYCLLRSKKKMNAASRLINMLYYYFETDYSDELGKRIIVVEGNVTDKNWFSLMEEYSVDTVINCAAVVKHFSEGTEIEDVNVGGAKNLIDFCEIKGACFIQTSTMSTVTSVDTEIVNPNFVATEKELFFNQSLENKYARAKFLSERAVVEAITKGRIKGKIMRLGNLAARHSDGEFQINYQTNSAMGRLKAFVMLGCCSYEQFDSSMEFSPIDAVADAIVKLSKTPDDCIIFHPYNNQRLFMEKIFAVFNDNNLPVRGVEREEFAKVFAKASEDPVKVKTLTSIMAYMATPGEKNIVALERHNEYTMQVLYRMGFAWPLTTYDYIESILKAIQGLGFFDN